MSVIDPENRMIALAASAAQSAVDTGEGTIIASVDEITTVGGSFVIPLMLPKGMETGDGRTIMADAEVTTRDLPIPLLWQPQTGTGHDGSFVIGRINSLEIGPAGITNAVGEFDTGPYGREAERLVRNGMLRGISADLDMFELAEAGDLSSEDQELSRTKNKLFIKKCRTMAATLLPKQAFMDCWLIPVDELNNTKEENPVIDGIHQGEVDIESDPEAVVTSLIASAIPVDPPSEWFKNPELQGPTPLTVDENGQVYGHIATWTQDHIGYQYTVAPPRSKSKYAYFHTGVVHTADGDRVPVGQLTLAGGHADMTADAARAVEHYDSTGSAVADVHAGEDAFGIWVAGALRPGVTPEQIRVLRASAPSGDWRPINNRLELVAVCQVNVPGFPIVRTCIASGAVTSLVAAGAGTLYSMKEDKLSAIQNRVEQLERDNLLALREKAIAMVKPAKEKRNAELLAAAEKLKAQFAPLIEARKSLQVEEETQVRDLNAEFSAAKDRFNELKLTVRRPNIHWDEKLHPRDRSGKFRDVLFKLSDLFDIEEDESGAKKALTKAADAQDHGDSKDAVSAAKEAKSDIEKMIKNTDNPEVAGRLSEASKELDAAIETEAKPKETLTEEALEALVALVVDELAEKVDPKRMAEAAADRLIRYFDSRGFESPEDLMETIVRIIEKDFKPGFLQ